MASLFPFKLCSIFIYRVDAKLYHFNSFTLSFLHSCTDHKGSLLHHSLIFQFTSFHKAYQSGPADRYGVIHL